MQSVESPPGTGIRGLLINTLLACSMLLVGCAGAVNAPRELLLEMPNDLSEYQQQMLEDAVVSDAEYQQAVQDAADCVAEQGYTVSDIFLSNEGFWLYGIEYIVGEAQEDAEQRASIRDTCDNEHQSFIAQYYYAQRRPEGAEREAIFQEMIECLEGYGITGITSSFTENEVVGAIWSFTERDDELDIEVFTTCFFPNRYIFAGEAG